MPPYRNPIYKRSKRATVVQVTTQHHYDYYPSRLIFRVKLGKRTLVLQRKPTWRNR